MGYIGLPTACVLAESGHKVLGVDIKDDVVSKINKGESHFLEPGLEKLLKKMINNENLKASNKPDLSDVFIIAVPTPFKKNIANKDPDISFVIEAINSIIPFLRNGSIVIIESTCPVGTTEMISNLIKEKTKLKEEKIFLAYCPERVLPGNTLYELKVNNRIIGGVTKEASLKVKTFYESFCKGNISITNAITAELSKLTENAFRDVNIAFANEISMICDKFNINVYELINLTNQHPRVNLLQPGCGVGAIALQLILGLLLVVRQMNQS